MNLKLLFRIVTLLAVLVVGAGVARAEDIGAVKSRMAERLGTVDGLKEKKLVGENNRGYLEARASLTPSDEKTMSDENSDRRAVYSALAAQTGASPDEVGRRRAQQIAISSKRGVWVQAPDGSWAEKG